MNLFPPPAGEGLGEGGDSCANFSYNVWVPVGKGESMAEKTTQQSLANRIFRAPVLLGLVGVGCMIYGVADGFKVMQFFFGVCIVGGRLMLNIIRKKDWDAHWADLERVREAHEKRVAEEAEKKK